MILKEKEAVHTALAEALMKKETLDRDEILAIKEQYEKKNQGVRR